MALNLVSLISQFITPDIISRIAEALGIDRTKAQNAVAAAVPGVLAGLASSAAQPGGAQRVTDAVNQSSGILDNVTSMLGGGDHASLAGMGSQLMSSLFGSRDSQALGDAVGRYAGMSPTQSSSLLGMLAPLVMGGIGKVLGGGGQLDAGGIASLLAGQKDNIMSALPSSFSNLLSGTGLFSAFSGAARTAQAAGARVGTMAGDGMRAAASTAQSFGDATQRAGDRALNAFDSRLYWLVPLLALTALVVWFFAGNAHRDSIRHASAVPPIMIGSDNVGAKVARGVTNLRHVLADVSDPASARAALPRLRLINEHLSTVKERLEELTPDQRRELARIVEPSLPAVDKAMSSALAAPGVSEELRPTLEDLRTKLDAFSS